MKKFFSLLLILFFVFSFPVFAGRKQLSLKEKIILERIEKEKKEISLAIKVTEQELEVIRTISFNILLKYKKLDFLKRSSSIMKKSCFFFDSECKKVYNMSIVYLKNEMKLTKNDLNEYEKLLEEIYLRLNDLMEKHALLEKGIEVETDTVKLKPAIPELKNRYNCNQLSSWNNIRGVFVNPDEIKEMPFSLFIRDVVSLDQKGYVIVAEIGEYTLNFSYIKTPNIKTGEIVNSNKKLFFGAAGNPVMPEKILIFITKNGKFVNPLFLCR